MSHRYLHREPKERHYRIHYGATGYSYESIFGDYLPGAEEIVIEDPYIRQHHQIINFLRFCETAVRVSKPKKITLVTSLRKSVGERRGHEQTLHYRRQPEAV